MRKSVIGGALGAILVLSAGSAQAEGPKNVAPAAATRPGITLGFDITPEFYAASIAGAFSRGDQATTVARLSLSKPLPNGVNVSGALYVITREANAKSPSSTGNLVEVSASYRVQMGKAWSLTPSVTLGYAFGDEPRVDPDDSKAAEAYYALGLNADYRISPKLTWNVVSLRYRDAFRGDWKTPKIATGLTYALNGSNAAYVNIGKSWKDSGSGYKNDKFSIAFGLKHSF